MVKSAPDLLQTKLATPFVRAELVARPRLIDQFDRGLYQPLTLICAPAGFGKTTLIAAWLASNAGRDHPLAWVSLDDDDNDPGRFCTYLIYALAKVTGVDNNDLLSLLQSPQPPSLKAILTTLLSRLEAHPNRVVLVLDDYHLITARSIHEAMTFLLDHLPQQMVLVITSREDPPFPLARMRGRGQLAEIRSDELRFTKEEAAAFLRQVLSVDLTVQQVEDLSTRTEGWIAGLQLAALALKGRANVDEFISAFTGSHRYVLDYLTEEVLTRQDEAVQTFLLQTSVLDRMCGSLCDAVTGSAGGAQMLELLERNNLFVIALDEERRWYRYHHLFAEMLRRHLQTSQAASLPELHRRAMSWYAELGMIAKAIEHALAAEEFGSAAQFIRQNERILLVHGNLFALLDWFDALPDELIREDAELCHILAATLMHTNQLAQASAYLDDAERALQAQAADEATRSMIDTIRVGRALIRFYEGDLEGCAALISIVLPTLSPKQPLHRLGAELLAAHGFLIKGRLDEAAKGQIMSVVDGFRSVDRTEYAIGYMRSMALLAQYHFLRGSLRQAETAYAAAVGAVGQGQLKTLHGSAAYCFGMAELLRERDDLRSAEQFLEDGRDIIMGALTADAAVILEGYAAWVRLKLAQGDFDGASACLNEFAELASQRGFSPLLSMQVEALKVHVALARGELGLAADWLTANPLLAQAEGSLQRELEFLTRARALIALEREHSSGEFGRDALELLERLLDDAEAKHRMHSVIEILVLRSLALQELSRDEEALLTLGRAMQRAEPEGYVRMFVDEGAPMETLLRRARAHGFAAAYVTRLLAAFDRRTQTESLHPSGQMVSDDYLPLTERELEVLHLLAEGASNGEIAEALIVSVGTVKKHVNNIFLKLDAHNRTQAVTLARSYKLL